MRSTGIFVFVVFLLIGCGQPGLSKKQREQIRQGMADHEIKRITEAEIIEAVETEGERLIQEMSHPIDTTINGHIITWLPDSAEAPSTNIQQIREAYQYAQNKELPPYVSIGKTDTLLFAKPGSNQESQGIWVIYFNKKRVIQSIGD